LWPWLLRIAANAIINHAKRAAREFPAPDDPPDRAVAPRNCKASEMRAIEYRAQLFRLVGGCRRFRSKWSTSDLWSSEAFERLPQRLGKTEGAVKQLQLRAVQNLRAQMEGGHG